MDATGMFIIIGGALVGLYFTVRKILSLIEWNMKENHRIVTERRMDKYSWEDRL